MVQYFLSFVMNKSLKVAARQHSSTLLEAVRFFKENEGLLTMQFCKTTFLLRFEVQPGKLPLQVLQLPTEDSQTVLAPESLRSVSQRSLDPSWQGFEPKKRFQLLIELRYTGGPAQNNHTYSFSAVPTKEPNRESMSLLCSLKAARDNCITVFYFRQYNSFKLPIFITQTFSIYARIPLWLYNNIFDKQFV